MTSASEHTRNLLAAIIPARHDLLQHALRTLVAAQIPDTLLRNLYTLLERYSDVTGAVMTRQACIDMLTGAKVDAGTVAAYAEIYDELAQRPADDAAFAWALFQIRELAAERATRDVLTEGMEILTRGIPGDDDEVVKGHGEARAHVLGRFSDIDRQVNGDAAPEGDVRGEGGDVFAEYERQEALRLSGHGAGIRFGIPALDDRIDGLFPGELWLVVGFTSDGKTSMVVNLSWSAVVEQGKNVLFLTTETSREQVRRRILARHSCLPQFGAGDGINSREIKLGTLSSEDKIRFRAVTEDFDTNVSYGRLYLAQVPRAASISYVEAKASRIHRQMNVDLIVMDYLALLKSDRRRTTDREEYAGILKGAKQITTTFADGAGVPLVSPWQVSRSARIEAEKVGYYKLDATSETAETSNSCDGMIGLLAPLDNESRRCKVKTQLMKHRDGEKASAIELSVDYATSKFTGGFQQGTTIDTMFDPVGAFL